MYEIALSHLFLKHASNRRKGMERRLEYKLYIPDNLGFFEIYGSQVSSSCSCAIVPDLGEAWCGVCGQSCSADHLIHPCRNASESSMPTLIVAAAAIRAIRKERKEGDNLMCLQEPARTV